MSPSCWKKVKLNIVCLYKLCWIKIPGDHHFWQLPESFTDWVGIYSLHEWYVCDMFDKNEASWSWSLENFSTKTIAYHGRSQQKHRKQKHTGFLSQKCRKRAPLQHSSPSHQSLVVELNTFPLSKVRLKYCISSWPVGLWNQVLSIDRCGVWNRDLSGRVWVMKDKSFLDVF